MARRGLVTNLGKKVGKFEKELNEVRDFINKIEKYKGISDKHKHWCYEQGVIRIYRAFEVLMPSCLIALLNKDASHLEGAADIQLSKDFHLSKSVSEFIITGGGYFSFHNYGGLIQECKRFLPDDHKLIGAIKASRTPIEKMVALRNFSAHDSKKAENQVKKVLNVSRFNSPGKSLRGGKAVHGKPSAPIMQLIVNLEKLAKEIRSIAT